ncbi:HTH-type transcriptional regulator CysL [compost metagenome]
MRIRLSQGKSNDIRTDLKDGQIDIGLVHLPCNDHELSIKQLAHIQGCFVVGKAYQHVAENVLSSEELSQIPLLLLSRGSSTRQFVEHWFHSQGTFIEADMELSSMDILVEAAVRGYGAAFVTHAFIQEELLSEKLYLIRTAQPIPARTVAVATKRDSSLSLAASRFISLLEL